MILIADSSSTRTEWCQVEGSIVCDHSLMEGINPYFQNRREISRCVRLQLPDSYFRKKYEEVIFYGAGCANPEKKSILEASLVAQFKSPIRIESDLLGAARGLFGDESGIACILGTGSNSCMYDGHKIVKNVKPLGYILGDEGSSAVLGKMFLSDCLKGLAPSGLMADFYQKCNVTADDVMQNVYNCPFPNRFLSIISHFLVDYQREEYVYNLIYNNFKSFFDRNVIQYDYKSCPIRVTGSSAFKYAEILNDVADHYGVKIDMIQKTSLKGLVAYHTKKFEL